MSAHPETAPHHADPVFLLVSPSSSIWLGVSSNVVVDLLMACVQEVSGWVHGDLHWQELYLHTPPSCLTGRVELTSPSAARQEYACAVSLIVVLLIQPGSVQGLPHDTRACPAQCSSARWFDIPEIVHRVPCEVLLVGLLTPGGGL